MDNAFECETEYSKPKNKKTLNQNEKFMVVVVVVAFHGQVQILVNMNSTLKPKAWYM